MPVRHNPDLVIRDIDVATSNIHEYVLQQEEFDFATRWASWNRVRRAIVDYKRLKRTVKRQADQILEVQATLRRLSRHGRASEDPPAP